LILDVVWAPDGEVIVAVERGFVRAFSRAVVVLLVVLGGLTQATAAMAGTPKPPHPGGLGVTLTSVPVTPVKAKAPRRSQTDGSGLTTSASVTWPAGGTAQLASGAKRANVGGMPMAVRSAAASSVGSDVVSNQHAAVALRTAQVQVLSQAAAAKAGVAGVLFTVARADGVAASGRAHVQLDYSAFANAFGANFGARLRLVQLPDCALTTPTLAACQVQTPVGSTNTGTVLEGDVSLPAAQAQPAQAQPTKAQPATAQPATAQPATAQAATAQVGSPGLVAPGHTVVMAATSSNSSADGTFSSTSLSPAYGWSAGSQGGSFSYTIPLRMPPSIGGPAPQLSLAYDSGSVDAQTLAANGQTSWVGEGWNLQTGYIERSYRTCSQDGGSTADLCWFTGDNATLVFEGQSLRLVHDASTGWHAANDDALKIDHLTDTSKGNGDNDGEYWRIITKDGTQYYFGINKRYSGDSAATNSTQLVPVYGNNSGEPCYNATFANAHCVQAYRWNLDYIVDASGNSLTMFYAKSTGHIGLNNNTLNATYDYDDTLDHIDYGTRAGSEASQTAPMQVWFTKSGRCINTCQQTDYPDTPWDLYCSSSSSCPNLVSPAFWTQYKLSTVYTQVYDPGSSSYHKVDQWDLTYTYPTSGDNISPAGADTSPNLWLQTLTHTGYAANGSTTLAEPAMTFGGTGMFNRVDWGDDVGVAPFTHYRLTSVQNGVGGQTVVAYSSAQCTRANVPNVEFNPFRCFPEYFQPTLAPAGWGWFNKYVVTSVTEQDLTGGAPDEVWSYAYSNANTSDPSLWRHDYTETSVLAQRSWSLWQGYSTVTTTHGASGGPQTVTTNTFYRGMDGDGAASDDNSVMTWNTRRVSLTAPVSVAGASGISGNGGLCLNLRGGATTDGTPLELNTCTGATTQVFYWQPGGSTAAGPLVNPTSGKCLDILSGGTANGTAVQLKTCTAAANQAWQRQSDGSFLNPNSGRCLDDHAGSVTAGTNIDIWDCASSQFFDVFLQQDNGTYVQPQARRCLDITGSIYTDGTAIQNSHCTNAVNQQWKLQTNGEIVNPTSGKCIDLVGSGTTNGTQIDLSTCTAAANQIWAPQTNGTLVNPNSGRCLDAGSAPVDATRPSIQDCTTGLPQQWVDNTVDTEGNDGFPRESDQYDGSTALLGSVHIPTNTVTGSRNAAITPGSGSSAGGQVFAAHMVTDTDDYTRLLVQASSTWRWTETQTAYNSYAQPTTVTNLGDLTTSADDVCLTASYVTPDTTKWLIDFPAQMLTTDCAGSPGDADYLSGSQVFYDGSATNGATPTTGLVTKTTALASVVSGTKTWRQSSRIEYDTNSRSVATYDALDNKTTYAYTPTSAAPVTQVVVTNPLLWTTTDTIEPGKGEITLSVDPNGKTTTTQFDPLGRTTDEWLNNRPTTAVPDRHYVYTLSSSAVSSVETDAIDQNSVAHASFQLYDGRLRPRQEQAYALSSSRQILTDTTYDNRGQLAKTATFDTGSAPSATLLTYADSSVDNEHRFSYDNLQRPTADALWKDNVLQWQTASTYDGDRVIVTPPTGGTPTRTMFDALGRTVELDQYLGGAPTGSYQATQYAYDRLGDLTSMTDPGGNTWTASYDLRGRTTSQTDPDTGTASMTYDDDGNVLANTDARNVTLSYVYDALNRVTAEWQGAPSTGTKLIDYTYDTLDKGLPTAGSRHVGTNTYTTAVTGYDDAYRPLGSTVTIPSSEGFGATSWTTSLTFDPDGSINSQTLPAAGNLAAETVNYSYWIGALNTITGQDHYVGGVGYDDMDRLTVLNLGQTDTVSLARQYDDATGRLVHIATATPSDGTKLAVNYSYDPAGNVTSKAYTEADASTSNECFQYDGLRELTQAWTTTASTCQSTPTQANVGGPDAYWQSFTYDTIGDRASQVVHAGSGDTTYTYNYPTNHVQPHAVSSINATGATTGSSTYAYDVAGETTTRNVMAKPGQTLTWDPEGRLATDAASGQTTTDIYDAFGNRLLAKDSNGSTLYLGPTDLYKNASGQVTATRYYGYGDFDYATRADNGTLTYLAQDNHGTTELALSASTGAVTARLRTDPFGNPRDANAWPTTHGFIDGNTDPTGLTHLGARDYDPTIGRFISTDPILEVDAPQQWAGYSYASNNPTSLTDPTGLDDTDSGPEAKSDGGGDFSGGPFGDNAGDISTGGGGSTADAEVNEALQLEQQATARANEAKQEQLNNKRMAAKDPVYGADLAESTAEAQAKAAEARTARQNSIQRQIDEHTDPTEPVVEPEPGPTKGPSKPSTATKPSTASEPDAAKTGKPTVASIMDEGRTAVIGRMKDIKQVGPNEFRLADLLPDQGSPKANWRQNFGVLRQVMGRGQPIRDASVGSDGRLVPYPQSFLNAERNELTNRGWTYNPRTTLWTPPRS
jgi:RHS repeat-associated protein